MKCFLAAVVVSLASTVNSFGQILYDIDFSTPPQTANHLVVVGAGPDFPTAIQFGLPMVVSSFGGLTNQPLRLDMAGNSPSFYYDQISLSIPDVSNAHLRVEFDFESHALIGSTGQFTVLFDTPTVRNVIFDSNGNVRLLNRSPTGYYETSIGSFSDDLTTRIAIDIDQLNNSWSVYSGSALLGSAYFAADERISSIRFSFGLPSSILQPDQSAVGIDNLVVAVIPELNWTSATAAIAALACVLFRKSRMGAWTVWTRAGRRTIP
jgi:hypothetical protein